MSTDLCTAFCALYLTARGLSSTATHRASTGSNNATPNPAHSAPPQTTKRSDIGNTANVARQRASTPTSRRTSRLTPQLPATDLRSQADRDRLKAKEELDAFLKSQKQQRPLGGLSDDSVFGDTELASREDLEKEEEVEKEAAEKDDAKIVQLKDRNPNYMEARLNPKPQARARWMRKMVIRDIRKRGRLSKVVRIARTERSHTSKSAFFKTSIKKLAPLARQIAGKSIDEAILQMRFSKKRVARDVLEHLVQARDEAIVIKGMALPEEGTKSPVNIKAPFEPEIVGQLIKAAVLDRDAQPDQTAPVDQSSFAKIYQEMVEHKETQHELDVQEGIDVVKEAFIQQRINPSNPSNTPPSEIQTPVKKLQKGIQPAPTDMYVAQAWVNRGPYGKLAMPRARGRMDVQRPPFTGLSVMLKEERTRTREHKDKEIKAIRKRLNGKIWTQLPDKPIHKQSNYVLW